MYTWGDLQETVLAKLDLAEDEAEVQGLITRFVYFANEAMTQICSAIKPKATFFEVEINDDNIFTKLKMPEDFISFGDDVNKIVYSNKHIGYSPDFLFRLATINAWISIEKGNYEQALIDIELIKDVKFYREFEKQQINEIKYHAYKNTGKKFKSFKHKIKADIKE